uniref:sorting nexin-4 isoform X2 n=1 Tax=Myxine glutinosa TaxID=7769 RepID=UPI00358F24BB
MGCQINVHPSGGTRIETPGTTLYRFADGDRDPTSVWRRYSEFEVLRNYLLVTHPHVVIPPLPEKRAEFVWHKLSADNMDPDFVERRRVGLETFLLRVIEHLQLSQDPIVLSFLSQENGWKETVNNTEFQAKADSLLKSLSATFRVKSPDKRFVELKRYCDELHAIISQILKIQMRLADRLYGIYKIHSNYGRVFSEWSAIEKDMGDGLQSAGHHMDVYAASIDDMLEEEEHYADHLKEFLYYTESLRSVCSKHELLQYELEQLQYALLAKKQQREELSTGMVRMFSLKGVTSKLFGQETAEQRQSKLQLMDKEIAEDERCVSAKTQENRDFVEKAWKDVERFQRQKYKDLKETLRSYATMQMNMCKKGIAVWTNAKECFNKI